MMTYFMPIFDDPNCEMQKARLLGLRIFQKSFARRII